MKVFLNTTLSRETVKDFAHEILVNFDSINYDSVKDLDVVSRTVKYYFGAKCYEKNLAIPREITVMGFKNKVFTIEQIRSLSPNAKQDFLRCLKKISDIFSMTHTILDTSDKYNTLESANMRKLIIDIMTNKGIQLSKIIYIPKESNDDREFVKSIIVKNGLSLQFASENLRSDSEIVILAMKQNNDAIVFANKQLFDKFSFAYDAVLNSGTNLKFMSEVIRNHRDLVLTAVKNDGEALKYASDFLQGNFEIIVAAVDQSSYAIEYVNHDREYPDYSIKYANKNWHADVEVLALERHGILFKEGRREQNDPIKDHPMWNRRCPNPKWREFEICY